MSLQLPGRHVAPTGIAPVVGMGESAPERSSHFAEVEAMERFLDATGSLEECTLPRMCVPSLPGYEIIEVLGQGGMGIVYKARDVGLNRFAAIKMIVSGAYARPIDRIRFLSEAEAVARLEHPNIVQIYEIGEHEGLPYLALEYVEGGTLHQRSRKEPLPSKEAAELVASLAGAVHAAHEKGIIHRDLKPANILVTRDGRVKIADFGLARHSGTPSGISRSEELLGTPTYMAPEQVDSRFGPNSRMTDVYGLGAILYELLTGRPPFQGASPIETVTLVMKDEPISPRRINPKVTRDLDTICLKALSKTPTRRYSTALDLADDLHRSLQDKPINARAVGPHERLWRWSRRNPVVAAALLLLAIALGIVVLALERANRHAMREHQQRFRLEVQLAANCLDHGLSLCEKGHEGLGVLWMAHALKLLPRGSDDFDHTIRANLSMWQARLFPLKTTLQHARTHAPTAPGHADSRRRGSGIVAVALSPDGKWAMTGGRDFYVRLWDISTGKSRWFARLDGPVFALCFSADGNVALVGGLRQAHLRDVKTGAVIGEPLPFEGPVFAVALSANGKKALIGGKVNETGVATQWDLTTGKKVSSALRHAGPVRAVAVSADGRTLLTGSDDGTAKRWDAATSAPIGAPLRHGSAVSCAAFSPDGMLTATGSADNSVQFWETNSGNSAGRALWHEEAVLALAFSPDGRTLVTGSKDRTCRVWDLTTRRMRGAPMEHRDEVRAVASGCEGQLILTGCSDGAARVWNIASHRACETVWDHDDFVVSVCISPDGKIALTGCRHGDAFLRDLMTGKQLGRLRHTGSVTVLAFSSDGRIALTCDGKTVRLWQTASGQFIRDFKHDEMVRAAAFGRNNDNVIIVDEKGNVIRIDVAGQASPLPLLTLGMTLNAAVISPNKERILVANTTGQTQVCEIGTGERIGPILQHSIPIDAVAFGPNGDSILTGSRHGVTQIWETATGKTIGRTLQHRRQVTSAAFSADGRVVATGSGDGTACLWSPATGRRIGKPLSHGIVNAVAFSPDSSVLCIGTDRNVAVVSSVLPPLDEAVDSIAARLSSSTGLELDDAGIMHAIPTAISFEDEAHVMGAKRLLMRHSK